MQLPDSFEIRVALCAPQLLDALRRLDVPGVCVCDAQTTPPQPARLAALQPHVLALPVEWATPEALAAVLAVLPATPPRVAAFRALDELPGAVRSAMAAPLPALALPSLPARRQAAEAALAALGVPRALGGFDCLALGAAWLSAMPAPFPPAQHWLYPLLGEALSIRPAAAERRIRSAIESAWLHGDLNAQSALLGLSVSPDRGKPTNSELLSRLAERVRELMN